nr:hypothetical protein [Candidatus Sigynarchaeota archaeon]
MEKKQPTCFMKYKRLPCIKATSPNPRDIECERCLWNYTRGGSISAMEKLFARYRGNKA